ncbi:signal recognition particle-docking protein FtsY [Wolbachia endosymbiont of Chironomus riparius]|uniref:signal recognition particle-docking protein FtsY n=1 Tax=Wolbachia endosymbiont of Chironomus riparius TaxID=2883238 RepID=UPI0020A1E3DD|nr:signal recognition particle-docking protein FtsY [Wolbachia endosymbiont of Chironomus riparius]
MSLFNTLCKGLLKTSSRFGEGIKSIFSTKKQLDQNLLDELEDLLISMDIGSKTSKLIIDKLASVKFEKEVECNIVKQQLVNEIEYILNPIVQPLILDKKPHIIMVCGVNGNGKTTTVGKLAYKYKKMGKSVMLVACDTFRAAASEQLQIWADRSGCSIITGEHGADSASIAYKSVDQAIKNNIDVVLIDTAGRLQNNVNLMEELSKIYRVVKKLDNTAPHNVILVLDATTGQNAYSQLETFNKMVNVTGLIITKLDGTAKGGVVVGLAQEYRIKLYAVGIGESIEDLREFTSREFAEALFFGS